MWWLIKSEVSPVFFVCSFSFSPFIRYIICPRTSTFWQHSPSCFICSQTDSREEHFLTNPNLLTFVILQMIDSSKSAFFFSGGLFSRSDRRYCFNHVLDPNILIVLCENPIIFVNLPPSFELIGLQTFKIGWLSLPRFNLSTSVRSFFFFFFWSFRCLLVS